MIQVDSFSLYFQRLSAQPMHSMVLGGGSCELAPTLLLVVTADLHKMLKCVASPTSCKLSSNHQPSLKKTS